MATRVVLNSKLDSAHVESFKGILFKAKDDDIEMDGSAVEQIGGQCLELMMSVRHFWGENGKTVELTNASDQLVEDLACFGLTVEDFQGRPA